MGVNRTSYPAKVAGPGLETYEGYFYPNGSGTVTDGYTPGVTAARTDVGIFTLTLPGEVAEVVYAHCELTAATAVDKIAKVKTAAASTGIITGVCWDISDAAVAELPAANADTKLFYRITVRNTSVTA
jgi:hypothetical protein